MTTDGPPRRRRSTTDLADAALDDPVAFAEAFERFRDHLQAVARRHRPSDSDPSVGDSDLVQDTYAAAAKHARRLLRKPDHELAAYFRAVLRRRARDLARAAAAAAVTPANSRAPAAADTPDPGQPPPDEVLAAKERSETVRAAVRELPPDHQAALDLRFGQGLSFAEVGRHLGKSADAVRKMLARAIAAVRRRVGAAESKNR